MAVPSLNLDDRTFAQLVDAAVTRIRQVNPEWTDFSPSNPGMTLVDVFAHLAEQLGFRMNRVSDKLKVELLRLLNVSPRAPAPAAITLRLERAAGVSGDILVPKFTRVEAEGGVVFTILEEKHIAEAESSAQVAAYQVERISEDTEPTLGIPGQVLLIRRGPIALNLIRELNVVVGVERWRQDPELGQEELQREDELDWASWREVENFAESARVPRAIQVDRWLGEVRFPPLFSAENSGGRQGVPEPGRRIRVWYYRTAGAAGNLPLKSEFRLQDAIEGIGAVIPVGPASGGRNAETIEQAVTRAPLDVAHLRRAVTSSDYEAYALQVPGVQRARALPAAQYRPSAVAGTVDLILVPALEKPVERISLEDLQNPQPEVLRQVVERLEARQVVGSKLRVSWANYQEIDVSARVVVDTTTPIDQMRNRLLNRLHGLIQPFGDWPFGQAVRVSNVYEALLAEPGVRYAEDVELSVRTSPTGKCRSIAALAWNKPGAQQPQVVWFAGSGSQIFQSQNQGGSWESGRKFTGEVVAMSVTRGSPILVAAAVNHENGAQVWVSEDAGETWKVRLELERHSSSSVGWVKRSGKPYLILGTTTGLFEVNYVNSDEGPRPVAFDPDLGDRGVDALATIERDGVFYVALAPRGAGELFLSSASGEAGTFDKIRTDNRQVSCVAFQKLGQRYFLWAGLAADGNKGYGCLRFDLLEQGFRPEKVEKDWVGGTCHALGFSGNLVLAGTNRSGVLRLDASDLKKASWLTPDAHCGLPQRRDAPTCFEEVRSLACVGDLAIVGTERGIYRSERAGDVELGAQFTSPADHTARDKVSLPEHWLPCSGKHDIDVQSIATL